VRLSALATRDFLAGVMFVAIGAAFMIVGWSLPAGTARSMGPGYFPMLLSSGAVLIGLATMARAALRGGIAVGPLPWRGIALVSAAIVFFACTVRGLGFVPSVFALSVLSSLAEPASPLWRTLLLALGLAAFCSLVFLVLLRMPYPLFGPWLGVG
jgi:hypothetical protein